MPRSTSANITNSRSGYPRLKITQDVADWLGGAPNPGWYIQKDSVNTDADIVFWSREAVKKPRLVLFVTPSNPVPAQAPDTIPTWVYGPDSVSGETAKIGAPFVKSLVVAQFVAGATAPQRQAAVDSVRGTVIGRLRSDPGEGLYYLSVADTAGGGQLVAAAAKLESLPQVAFATYDFEVEPAYRKPDDGAEWKTWHLDRDSQPSPKSPKPARVATSEVSVRRGDTVLTARGPRGLEFMLRLSPIPWRVGDTVEITRTLLNRGVDSVTVEVEECGNVMTRGTPALTGTLVVTCAAFSKEVRLTPDSSLTSTVEVIFIIPPGRYPLRVRMAFSPEFWLGPDLQIEPR